MKNEKKDYGILRVVKNEEETEIIESALTKNEAKELQKEYALSEKNNKDVTYLTIQGKMFE